MMLRIKLFHLVALVLSAPCVIVAQNFWEPANGAPVGAVVAMAVTNNGNLVVSTSGGYGGSDSIYISSDNGASWSSTDGPGGVGVILNSPNSFLFAEYSCCAHIYCSKDNGEHWITINAASDGHSMAIDSSGRIICSGVRETWDTIYQPHQETEILYYDTAVIEISSDEGLTWSETPLLSSSVLVPYYEAHSSPYISWITVGKNGTMFAGGSTGDIFQSNDAKTWVSLARAFPPGILSLVASPQGNLFAGTANGLFRLDDTNWTKLGNLNSSLSSINVDNRGVIYVHSSQGLLRSSDAGETWVSIQNGLGVLINSVPIGSSPVYCVCVSSDNRIFAGTPGALYVSTNTGTNWLAISHGLSFGANDLGFSIQTPIISAIGQLVVWTSGGLYNSTNDGKTWNIVPATLRTIGSLASAGNFIFVRSDSGYLRSSDEGLTWEPINEGLTLKDSSGGYLWFSSILSDPFGDLFLQSNFAWYVSTDFGTTWQQSKFENTDFRVFTSNSNGTIWGGGDDGIFQSTDRGATWHRTNNGLFDTTVFALTSDRKGNLFAATQSSRIFRSTDSGNSWQYLTTGDSLNTDPRVNSVLLIDSNNNLYWGMDGGVGILRSTDNGHTWNQENNGLTYNANHSISTMAVSSTGRIFAGTEFDGLYRSISTHSNTVQPVPLQQSSIFLLQNSPNPVTQRTTISFTLPEPSYVTINLYDATGREVVALGNGFMDAGQHEVLFQRGTLPSGVYFYRLESGGQSVARAMVIF